METEFFPFPVRAVSSAPRLVKSSASGSQSVLTSVLLSPTVSQLLLAMLEAQIPNAPLSFQNFLYKCIGTTLGACVSKELVQKQLQELLETARYNEEAEWEVRGAGGFCLHPLPEGDLGSCCISRLGLMWPHGATGLPGPLAALLLSVLPPRCALQSHTLTFLTDAVGCVAKQLGKKDLQVLIGQQLSSG